MNPRISLLIRVSKTKFMISHNAWIKQIVIFLANIEWIDKYNFIGKYLDPLSITLLLFCYYYLTNLRILHLNRIMWKQY